MAELADSISAFQWRMRIDDVPPVHRTLVRSPVLELPELNNAEMALEISIWQTLCTALGPPKCGGK